MTDLFIAIKLIRSDRVLDGAVMIRAEKIIIEKGRYYANCRRCSNLIILLKTEWFYLILLLLVETL